MLPIRIRTERGDTHDRPSTRTLTELLERIGAPGDRFLIVERHTADPEVFIQVWHEADDTGARSYQLEYREGCADRHFQAYLSTPEEVGRVMAGWARQEKGWELGPAWARLDLPVEAEPPALEDSVREQLEERIRLVLRCGYDGIPELIEHAEDYLVKDGVRPVSGPQARVLVYRLWRERVAEQATWTGETDPDRLTRAFAALDSGGITARENFTCCRNCGQGEIWEERVGDARGFVFFHTQCTESVAVGHDLHLYYGAFDAGDEETVSVGREVVAALDAAGLRWAWDGSAGDAIRVTGTDWRKRLTG
ncbi:DUF6891 domain-containing protein [Streptomyces sp. LN699]|uniref:DUF6891 domain-containing protein n=1 Tax=Streptomyces sp. LN699 TaxID=3112981 RepID=UPI0037150F1E